MQTTIHGAGADRLHTGNALSLYDTRHDLCTTAFFPKVNLYRVHDIMEHKDRR